jgi:hypothetical protein
VEPWHFLEKLLKRFISLGGDLYIFTVDQILCKYLFCFDPNMMVGVLKLANIKSVPVAAGFRVFTAM